MNFKVCIIKSTIPAHYNNEQTNRVHNIIVEDRYSNKYRKIIEKLIKRMINMIDLITT